MLKLQGPSSIALAAVMAVLLSSRPAEAQVFAPGGPPRHHGGLPNTTGILPWNEQASQARAERRLPHAREKLNRDVARNDAAAVSRDVRAIDHLHHRIMVDEWLLRYISCQELSYYPYPRSLDPVTFCAIAQYRTPPRPPDQR